MSIIYYNGGMRNKEGKAMSYYPQTIADKMAKGLTNEIEMYAAISKALREDGNSKSQVSYYMSVDEDFIPDVLQAYGDNNLQWKIKEKTMASDVVWMIDGIQVVWSPKYAVYEVWQRVEQDGETVLWDCVADTPDQEEAIEEAKEIHFAKLRETGESGSTEMPPLDVDSATSLFPDYFESGIDF